MGFLYISILLVYYSKVEVGSSVRAIGRFDRLLIALLGCSNIILLLKYSTPDDHCIYVVSLHH